MLFTLGYKCYSCVVPLYIRLYVHIYIYFYKTVYTITVYTSEGLVRMLFAPKTMLENDEYRHV